MWPEVLVDPGAIAHSARCVASAHDGRGRTATAVDAAAQTCTVHRTDGEQLRLRWDRLVLSPGSVTGTFGIAGVREYTYGFKNDR